MGIVAVGRRRREGPVQATCRRYSGRSQATTDGLVEESVVMPDGLAQGLFDSPVYRLCRRCTSEGQEQVIAADAETVLQFPTY